MHLHIFMHLQAVSVLFRKKNLLVVENLCIETECYDHRIKHLSYPLNKLLEKKKKGMFILIEIFNLAMLSYFHFSNTSYFHSVKQKMELNKVKKKNQKMMLDYSEQNLKKSHN